MSQFLFLQTEWPRRARGPAHRLLLRPPRARAGGGVGVQARRGAEAAVPGQRVRADPRAELQADRGRGGVQQGEGDRHARQPRGARRARHSARRRCGGAARAVPCRLLAGTHLRPGGAAGAGAGVRRGRVAEGHAGTEAGPRAVATPRSDFARARREARRAAGGQVGTRRRAEAPARRSGRGEEGGGGAARHARLLRSRDARLLHRPAAEGGRLAARSSARPGVGSRRHAEQPRQGFRRLRSVGRRRQAAGAGGGQAHAARWACRPAAGQAVCRLPGAAVRTKADRFLLQRLRALALGRHALPPAPGAGLLQEGRAGAAGAAPQHAAAACGGAGKHHDRRAPLPDPRHPPHRRSLRARPRPQVVAGDGHRLGQDTHGDRAGRPADAMQLGQARAVPGRPRGAGEPGGQCISTSCPMRLR
jgi:hypothetical protein